MYVCGWVVFYIYDGLVVEAVSEKGTLVNVRGWEILEVAGDAFILLSFKYPQSCIYVRMCITCTMQVYPRWVPNNLPIPALRRETTLNHGLIQVSRRASHMVNAERDEIAPPAHPPGNIYNRPVSPSWSLLSARGKKKVVNPRLCTIGAPGHPLINGAPPRTRLFFQTWFGFTEEWDLGEGSEKV